MKTLSGRIAFLWRTANLALLFLAALLAAMTSPAGAAEVRGYYLPTFTYDSTNDATAKGNIDAAIADAVQHKFNAIYFQARRRADLYFFPNRNSSKYANPDPRATTISSSFDALQYAIDKGHDAGLKVIAWLVTYPSWSGASAPTAPNHVYNAHPDWITQDATGAYALATDAGANAALDPGRQDVQDYLTNIYLDVVQNYDVDGIHFDYFRLPESGRTAGVWSKYGFNTGSLAKFTQDTGFSYNPASDTGQVAHVYRQWMREQIDNLAKRVWRGTKIEKPWVEVSSYIVNFDDSPEVLGQSYQMWTNRGHFDHIAGGSYDDGSTVDSYWTRQSNYIKVPGTNTLSRPIVFAAGSDTAAFGNTATTIVNTVNNVRSKSPASSGFVHFAYAGLAANTETLFSALSSGPYATADTFPGPSVMNALSPADTTAPSAPASSSFTPGASQVTLNFSRPAQAADGDYPIRYRIYRQAAANPKEFYENEMMELWDVPATRTSFSWIDTSPVSGSFYKIVAYDDWNNKASVTVGPAAVSSPQMIIETTAGGQNVAKYSEPVALTGDSSAKSTATGCTAGINSRYSSNAAISAQGRFTPGVTGVYHLEITVNNISSTNATNTTFQVSGGGPSGTIPMSGTNSAIANNWYRFASDVSLTPSTTITFSEVSPQTDRFNMDAIRLVPAGASSPWETKPELYVFPAPVFPVGSTVIADDGANHGGSAAILNMLNYDDDDSKWSTSTFGTNFNSGTGNNARVAQNANKASKGVFSVDLPTDGKYDIRAYVTNGGYSTTSKYQFRGYADSSFTVQNTYTITTTQSNVGTGFNVHVDGQSSDASSYWFKAGKVFVAAWDDSADALFMRNDAVQFKLIEIPVTGVQNWSLY